MWQKIKDRQRKRQNGHQEFIHEVKEESQHHEPNKFKYQLVNSQIFFISFQYSYIFLVGDFFDQSVYDGLDSVIFAEGHTSSSI